MVRIAPPQRPLSAAPRLRQDFEGHGLTSPAPFDRGYRYVADRPLTASSSVTRLPPDSTPAGQKKGKKSSAPVPTFTIHAHIREKTLTIQAGAGNQCIYWLGATAVQRYLAQPFSYTWTFSQELTAKAVIGEDGEHLPRTDKVHEVLNDGDHVWIDVGDGAPGSRVLSREFSERQIFEPRPDDEYQEQIGWQETAADMVDDEVVGIDPRHSMRYVRTVLAKQPTFKEWQQLKPASSQEGLFEVFNDVWHDVSVDDMPGSTSWMNEVKGALWHQFEPLQYIFSCQATVAADESKKLTMSLLEFWSLCKRCGLPTPTYNIAKIDKMFVTKLTEKDAHNAQRKLELHDFLGALIRLSVLRQPHPMKPDVPLPNSLTQLIEEKLLVLTPGCDTFAADKVAPALFGSPAVRQKLTIHESRLKQLFLKWAIRDEFRQTIALHEWLDMFAASTIMGADLTKDQLVRDFVIAMLGDHPGNFESWQAAGEQACEELIFPEFVEALMRVSLTKYRDDDSTSVDLKVHEICLLLTFGPAAA
eukprot:CAMPEP_0174731970 /NCGR_PEP_ID=MMETSP1094-20130205/58536_1 /TAXON_ID=156173 /ORGANISM="Chrysochromulina brevifilum, Strain UTEX LB 985" /LENGTH=529 /DNA_ID=CAMNT_0015934421 /DNA_START=17 /DNA_END=1606 /DNA_ORIENTATION=+